MTQGNRQNGTTDSLARAAEEGRGTPRTYKMKTKPTANDGLKGFYWKAMVIDSTFGNDQSLYYNNMYST